jgi:hypothetical protein
VSYDDFPFTDLPITDDEYFDEPADAGDLRDIRDGIVWLLNETQRQQFTQAALDAETFARELARNIASLPIGSAEVGHEMRRRIAEFMDRTHVAGLPDEDRRQLLALIRHLISHASARDDYDPALPAGTLPGERGQSLQAPGSSAVLAEAHAMAARHGLVFEELTQPTRLKALAIAAARTGYGVTPEPEASQSAVLALAEIRCRRRGIEFASLSADARVKLLAICARATGYGE